jgi:hypothetical protein
VFCYTPAAKLAGEVDRAAAPAAAIGQVAAGVFLASIAALLFASLYAAAGVVKLIGGGWFVAF